LPFLQAVRLSQTNHFRIEKLHLPANKHHPQYRQTPDSKILPCHCDYQCPSHSPSDSLIRRSQTSYSLLSTRHFFATPLRPLLQPVSQQLQFSSEITCLKAATSAFPSDIPSPLSLDIASIFHTVLDLISSALLPRTIYPFSLLSSFHSRPPLSNTRPSPFV